MNQEEKAVREFEQATAGFEEGLETCQKILRDYRSKLRGIDRTRWRGLADDDGGTNPQEQ